MSPTLYQGPPPTGKPGPTGLPKMKVDSNREQTRASPRFVFGGVVLVVGLSGYLYLRANPSAAPLKISGPGMTDSIKQYLQLPDAVRIRLGMKPADDKKARKNRLVKKGDKEKGEPVGAAPLQEKPFDPYLDTTLLLTNGERVTGELVRENAEQVVLKWDYGEATFKKGAEIVQIIRPLSKTTAPPDKVAFVPGDSLVLTMRNGEQLTGELVQELPDEWVIRFDFGEVNFKKDEITDIKLAAAL